jgi:hypothetical protein
MIDKQERERNNAAYRRLKEFIRQHYPHGRFVAIAGGAIVADGPSFEALDEALRAMGNDSAETMIVQAGFDYPEYAVILAQEQRP